MSKSYIEWVATETPSRWCVDRANVKDMEKAVKMGFTFGAGNPVLTLISIKMEYERMAPHIAEVNEQGLKGDAKILELYRRYILPSCEVLMPVFEKTEGKWGRQCVMVNPNKGYDTEYMIKQGLEIYSWAPNISVKIPVTHAGLIAIEELASRGVHVTGTVGYSVAQGLQLAAAHDRGVKRAIHNGIKPMGANFALFTIRLNQWVLEDAIGNGYTWITAEDAKWAGVAVGKRIARIYDEKGYIDNNDLWFVPAGIKETHAFQQFVGGRVLFDAYMPEIEFLESQLKDAPREYHFDDPIDPVALDRLMGSPLFRKMYGYDGLETRDFYTFGPLPHIAACFGTMGFDQIANL